MGCASSAPTANAAAGEVGNGSEGQAEEWTLCGCGGNRRAKEGKVRTQAGGEKRRRTRENEAQKGEALRDGRAVKNERNAEVMRGGDRGEERDEGKEAHEGRVGGKVRAEGGQNGAELCDGTGMDGGAGGGTLKVRSTKGAAGRGRVQTGRALAWQRGRRGEVGGRDARASRASSSRRHPARGGSDSSSTGRFTNHTVRLHMPPPLPLSASPVPATFHMPHHRHNTPLPFIHSPHRPSPTALHCRSALPPRPAQLAQSATSMQSPARVGVLAFEVAAAVVRAGVVRQSVEGEDVDELRTEVLASDGIAFLLSSDFNHVWQIAARDKWEEVGRLAASVARLGSQCTDTALHSLALRFSREQWWWEVAGRPQYSSEHIIMAVTPIHSQPRAPHCAVPTRLAPQRGIQCLQAMDASYTAFHPPCLSLAPSLVPLSHPSLAAAVRERQGGGREEQGGAEEREEREEGEAVDELLLQLEEDAQITMVSR
ncbi:unnamed protein product [Closterium sp. NIES-53]